MKRDLAQLYSQLDLQPDCTLEEFQRTYRRRIAELHPDRGADAATPEVRLLLPELIWLYATATRFYRRHGRLPGARFRRDPSAGSQPPELSLSPAVTPFADPPAAAYLSPPTSDAHETPPGRSLAWAISFLVLLIVTSSWGWLAPTTTEAPTSATASIDPEPVAPAATPDQLGLGMDAVTVIAIQGEPMLVRDTRWSYGPSWLEFEEGRVVDWYSSPLHPLKTATASPTR